MQRALIEWWAWKHREFVVPEFLLFSIPNGGGRSGPVVGAILKAEGLRAGAPDLFLAMPRPWSNKREHGLFLELKTAFGRVSPEQEFFHRLLADAGYQVAVCRSFDECVRVITEYLTQ